MELNFDLQFGNSFSLNPNSILDQSVIYDMLIIGGGPAGLNAALYAKRKGLNVAILTKRKGGLVVDTSVVDNYLGLNGMSGEGLVHQFLNHTSELEIPIMENADVINIDEADSLKAVTLSTGEVFKAKTILIATGSNPRKLDVKGEMTYAGRGVAYCVICDAPLFKGKDVFVAGGGNSAVEAAIDLAKVANSVTLVHRSQFRADQILLDQLFANKKIKIYLNTQILEILGDEAMTGLLVRDKSTDATFTLDGDGIFIEIGHNANSEIFKDILDLNSSGEILVDDKNQTNVPGIFAAGDVTQIPYKQIIIAASDGAKAALAANDYINQMNSKSFNKTSELSIK